MERGNFESLQKECRRSTGYRINYKQPVPVDPNLCGQSVCLQWVVGCGGGEGITPAVQFTIAGS